MTLELVRVIGAGVVVMLHVKEVSIAKHLSSYKTGWLVFEIVLLRFTHTCFLYKLCMLFFHIRLYTGLIENM